MSAPKWTPGPWDFANWRETDRADRLIATVAIVGDCVVGPKFDDPNMTNYESHGGDVEDSRLIAIAPDLYEAVQQAASVFRLYESLHRAKQTPEADKKADDNAALATHFEALLAKARGEA